LDAQKFKDEGTNSPSYSPNLTDCSLQAEARREAGFRSTTQDEKTKVL